MREPTDVAAYDEGLARTAVGGPKPLTGPIEIQDYDPAWPRAYERERARISAVLGERVIRIEHVGSTSVPELAAKPIIDVALEVADSAAEREYASDLEEAGYVLRIREPEWYEHRVFKASDPDVNLHVFSAGCAEVERMLQFRDWLRLHPEDRERYSTAKRKLAVRDWKYMQQYADAKTGVIDEIMARAGGLDRHGRR